MNLLLKSVKLISDGHPYHNQNCDIYIEDGIYKKIGSSLSVSDYPAGTATFEKPGLMISIGWLDMRCRFGEPGDEQQETIISGLNAAAAGGFTGVVVMPSTQPPAYTRSAVEYIKSAGRNHITDIFP
ncbi:MAG: dihydroorotase, partial [Bacteroidota bacterium]